MSIPSQWTRWCGLLVVGACLTGLALFLAHRHFYPFGMSASKLPTFMHALRDYADDHDGWYPQGGETPLDSLQRLYPVYADAALSGLSGSTRRTLRLLRDGERLDDKASSWVYWPGFRSDDDPRIAIIWEREEGVFITGGRAVGHAAGFADGGYDQIPIEEWEEFLREQRLLRESVLEARTVGAETPP